MMNRLAVVVASTALCVSVWTLVQVEKIDHVAAEVGSGQHLESLHDESDRYLREPSSSTRAWTDIPEPDSDFSSTRAGTFDGLESLEGQAEVAIDRGDEQVIDIGEHIEIDALYLDARSDERVDLGASIEP